MNKEVKDILSSNFYETLYVFIGNDLRGDDACGPYICKNITNPLIRKIDAQSVFESYVWEIIEIAPKKLIIIDAADFGGEIGEIRLLDENNIKNYRMVSTHTLGIDMLIKVIRDELKNIEIYIIGIQLKNIEFNHPLSPEVRKSCNMIIDLLNSFQERSNE